MSAIPTPALAVADASPLVRGVEPARLANAVTEPAWVRRLLIGLALAFLALFLVLPLAEVFAEGFKGGLDVWKTAVTSPDALSAIRLTLLIAAISVPAWSRKWKRMQLMPRRARAAAIIGALV